MKLNNVCNFSRSYCCMRYDRLLAWYCRLSVCLSVTLCTVAKRYILHQRCHLNKWIGTASLEHNFTTFNPLHWPYPVKLPTPKFGNFTSLLYCVLFCWSLYRIVYVDANCENCLLVLEGLWLVVVTRRRPMKWRVTTSCRQELGIICRVVVMCWVLNSQYPPGTATLLHVHTAPSTYLVPAALSTC